MGMMRATAEKIGGKEFDILDFFLVMDLAKKGKSCKVIFQDGKVERAKMSIGPSDTSVSGFWVTSESSTPEFFDYDKYGEEFGVISA